jgi:sugar lactone lactonase YvrE
LFVVAAIVEVACNPNGTAAPVDGTPTSSSGAAGVGGASLGDGGASNGGASAVMTPASAVGTGGIPTSVVRGDAASDARSVAGARGGSSGADGGAQVTYPPLDATQFATPIRVAASQTLTLAESPLWDPCAHRLLFVDVSASKIYSLTLDEQLSVFASDTGNSNGMAFDLDGSLVLAQMAKPGHIVRRDASGTLVPIDPKGPPLHTPDDLVVRSDGTIFFSDGQFEPTGSYNPGPLPVYSFKPGDPMLTSGGTVRGPNGVELSPDEKTLYVDAYYEGTVVKFAVNPDGSFVKGPVLAQGLVNPDSLCLDAAGNLYVGVSKGLQVLRPDGSPVVLIPIDSAKGVTNCTFGGDDGKLLYITAFTSVWKVPGAPIPGLDWIVDRRRLGCTT